MTTNNKIDLNTCVPGQNLERRDGALVTYKRKSIFSIDYPHLVDCESYTDDGYYRVSRTEDSWDIVKIFPIKKPKLDIDLTTCVLGQKLKLRNGTIVKYKRASGLKEYPHLLNNDKYYTNEGCYHFSKRVSPVDVVEILPMEYKPVTNLRACVPGQKIKLRCGGITTYKEANDSDKYPHRLHNGLIYTDEGYYWSDKEKSDNDVMEILPMECKPVTDLRTCVPGQKLRLRRGSIVAYKKATDSAEYPHMVCTGGTYTDEGYYWIDKARSQGDVMEILPLEEEPKLDLNTCVPGQKVRLRYGKINYYTGPIKDGYGGRYTHDINGDSYMNNGCYWADYRESELDVVEILPMEEEPAKTPAETTQLITDQIDVSSPDHVSIIPNENGVTISIKKGKTTINWRHSNS